MTPKKKGELSSDRLVVELADWEGLRSLISLSDHLALSESIALGRRYKALIGVEGSDEPGLSLPLVVVLQPEAVNAAS
jgi:hypothetical protein